LQVDVNHAKRNISFFVDNCNVTLNTRTKVVKCDDATIKSRVETLLQRLESTLHDSSTPASDTKSAQSSSSASVASSSSTTSTSTTNGSSLTPEQEAMIELDVLSKTCLNLTGHFAPVQIDSDKQLLNFTVDDKPVTINYKTKEILCEDSDIHKRVETIMRRIEGSVGRL
jgi:hypothetical protein